MSRTLNVTGNAITQVITIEFDGERITVYPTAVPRLVADLMTSALALGLGQDYPMKPTGPIELKN